MSIIPRATEFIILRQPDNPSWEIGFYAGITHALEQINQELERKRVESEMVGNNDN